MGIPPDRIRQLVEDNIDHCCGEPYCVRIVAVADLPTRFGQFQVAAFESPGDQKEHAALIRGNPLGQEGVPVRLHSECLTGDTFGSYRCDCREQLELALRTIGELDNGIILYLRQEGRGIGFANKIKAYQLQEVGFDTIQANELLGFRADERDYAVAAHMLRSLDVQSIRLMSNNPHKISDLQSHGIKIQGRIPITVPPNPHNRRYLETKRVRAGHLLQTPTDRDVPEQLDSATNGETPS
ncbi:MAG TPA: GTP cyclohydrolase II [Thermoplasmata archaeon]|nr:GTP cyclohydrolase II [Thermoplasmata archaeon]